MKITNLVKKLFIIMIIASLMLCQVSFVSAHSGRTDSQGGHHDYKNASGLGSYHYHCNGHPAHLHNNGICPYRTSNYKTSSTSKPKKVSKYYKKSTVKKVQKKLNKLGYKCGKVDGKYDKKVKNALKRFKRDNNMTINAKINKKLIKKLHIKI